MGFLWEGSTGARAVAMLRALPQGTVIETPRFAAALGVDPGALHQLLANAVQLRLLKKIRGRGPCIGWTLGAGNVNATIERRRPPRPPLTPEEAERRRAAAERREERGVAQPAISAFSPPAWPPGFVSQLTPPGPRFADLEGDGAGAAAEVDEPLPLWLRGLGARSAPPIDPDPTLPAPAPPRPLQLPLFDPSEIGEGGRARWRRLDLALPMIHVASNAPSWRQTTFLEALALKS
jgi:hypothetical protein